MGEKKHRELNATAESILIDFVVGVIIIGIVFVMFSFL